MKGIKNLFIKTYSMLFSLQSDNFLLSLLYSIRLTWQPLLSYFTDFPHHRQNIAMNVDININERSLTQLNRIQ